MADISRRLLGSIGAMAVAALALVGCDAPAPLEPTSTMGPDASATPEPTETGGPGWTPVAVVTIAAVEVDGSGVLLSGMVTEVAEEGGDCLFRLAPGDSVSASAVERHTVGVANVGTTSCGSVVVPIGEVAKGTWTASLEYRGPGGDVASEPVTVEVP